MPGWPLPNEITLEITRNLSKNDLLNLYSTCHHLRAVVASIIYRDIDLTSKNIYLFLRTATLNLEFTSYVKKARLNWSGSRDFVLYVYADEGSEEFDDTGEFDRLDGSRETREIFVNQILRLGYRPHLQDAVLQGSESAHVMFLLMLLENLEELEVFPPVSATQYRQEILGLMCGGRHLSKLKRYHQANQIISAPLRDLNRTLRRDRIPKISRLGLFESEGETPIDTPNGADYISESKLLANETILPPPLEHLSITTGAFSIDWLQSMLGLSQTVQRFDFCYDGLNQDEIFSVPSLCETTLPNLHELSIYITRFRRRYDEELALRVTFGSWQAFTKLKVLRGPVDILFGAYCSSSSTATMTMVNSKQFRLPPSLETIQINSPIFLHPDENLVQCLWSEAQILRLLQETFSDCNTHYPRLRKIRLGCVNINTFSTFLEFLKKQGKPPEMTEYARVKVYD